MKKGLNELSNKLNLHTARFALLVAIGSDLCYLLHMKTQSLTLNQYIEGLQKKGRYTFTREEAIRSCNLTPTAFKFALHRLSLKKKIAQAVREFYVIVPIEYQDAGAPPPTWFIDDLMRFFEHPYYVGLLSAAALHGAAHQQPQEFQVLTDISIRPIRVGNARIAFFKKRTLNETMAQQIKTTTGYMKVSTPETTALDLVRYFKVSGYVSHVATILNELREEMDSMRLLEAAKDGVDLSSIQRLGYLLELVSENKELTEPLHDWLKNQHPRLVPLLPEKEIDTTTKNARWKLYINEVVEIDE